MTGVTRTIVARAADPKTGMTLGELGAAVQVALRADLPDTTKVEVRIGWRGQIQTLMIKEVSEP